MFLCGWGRGYSLLKKEILWARNIGFLGVDFSFFLSLFVGVFCVIVFGVSVIVVGLGADIRLVPAPLYFSSLKRAS